MEVKLTIVKETTVLGKESYHLVFGQSYIPGSLCDSYEKALEIFNEFKDQVRTPKKEEVHFEYINIDKK